MQEGQSHLSSTVVTKEDTAEALGQGTQVEFPAVFATAKMIALMEFCSAELMKPLLKDGELSVGVGVNITHLAATPVGEKVTAKSTYIGLEAKLYKFKVEVSDRGGIVGKGIHTRAIVEVNRIMAGTAKRLSAST